MNKILTFRKDFWSSVYEVKEGKKVIAQTGNKSVFSYDSNVTIGDKYYSFEFEGFFNKSVLHISDITKNFIGSIKLGFESIIPGFGEESAKIHLITDETLYFKKIDYLPSEWQLYDDSGVLLHFKKDLFVDSGKISVHEKNDLFLAIGLFLMSFYQRRANYK
jgi:hypothetical protein